MYHLTKSEVLKLASDYLRVPVERLDAELKCLSYDGRYVLGMELHGELPRLVGNDLTLFYVLGGNAFTDYKYTYPDAVSSVLVDLFLWGGGDGVRVISSLSELCRGSVFLRGFDAHLGRNFVPFSLLYYKITII